MFGRTRARTPASLPRRYAWATEELVNLRVENSDLRQRCVELAGEAAAARGENVLQARMRELER